MWCAYTCRHHFPSFFLCNLYKVLRSIDLLCIMMPKSPVVDQLGCEETVHLGAGGSIFFLWQM